MTEKLFQQDMYMKNATAQVVEINENKVILDKTIFAPDAGGQTCDMGTISGCKVIAVHEKDGIITHTLDDGSADIKKGDSVELVLDWDRRFDHMQNHLGEHILSGLFKSEYNLDNKGFHLGDDVATFDIDIPEITEEMLDNIENLANNVVYSALPVEITLIADAEAAKELPLRKELKVDEDITVVTVPGVDCVACCCPHPSDTSQIGIIKLIRTEKYKGMTRVYFKCGRRALLDYRQKHKVVSALNEKYSADEFTLLDKVKIADDKNDGIRRELGKMRDTFADIKAAEFIENSGNIVLGEMEKAEIDDLKRIAKKIMQQTDKPVVLSSVSALSVFMTHSGKSQLKCGTLVREFASGAGGKGGGSDTQAQVIFNNYDLMSNFIKIVESSVQG